MISYKDLTDKLTSKVLDEETRTYYTERLAVNTGNINQCCIDHPLLVNDVVFYYEQSFAEEGRYKDLITRAHATYDSVAREMLTNSGLKVTEAKVEATIRTFDDYVELQALWHAAKANTGAWRAMKEAVNDRKFMLVQVASNYRAEGNSAVVIRN